MQADNKHSMIVNLVKVGLWKMNPSARVFREHMPGPLGLFTFVQIMVVT